MKKYLNGKSVRAVLAVMLLSVSVACVSYTAGTVTAGFDIKEDTVNQIVKGQTTQAEIVSWFGAPTSERTVDGKDQYFYEYREAKGVGVGISRKHKTLLVLFNNEKVVEDYVYKVS